MKKYVSILLAVLLCVLSAACGSAETGTAAGTEAGTEAAEFGGVFPSIAGENGTTYVSLFDVIISDQWTPLWQDYISAIVGEDAAPEMTARLQGSITSELYGEAAVKAFADGGYAFDCDFINGAQSITFQGDTATILKTDGTSETHTYEYLGQYNVGETETMVYQGTEISMAFPVDVYKSKEEAGEFTYFFLREDTMAETYHIEFRYGRDLEELQGYMVGPYAYWLAAGIDERADDDTIQKVIALFCLENMDYSAHAEAALAQLADLGFIGAWQADMSPFGEAYAGTELTMTIDGSGHGVTFMNGEQTADFEAYAVDSGEAGDGQGLYVAWSNLEYEAEAAPYSMVVNDDGQTVLTLTAEDGAISWIRRADDEALEAAQPEIRISSVDDLLSFSAGVNDGSAFGYAGQTILLDVDLDLTGVEWEPIGNLDDQEYFSTVFMETFDGQGHTISNLICETDESTIGARLFGVSFGVIRNVNMEHCTVSVMGLEPGASQAVGVIVGYNMGGMITGCSVSDSNVTGLNCVGAVAGGSGGVVTDCTVTDCTVTIIGDNDFTDGLKQCDVAECGGLVVGGAFGGTVSRCTASGRIIAEGNEPVGLGGIAGCLEMMNDASDNTVDVEIFTDSGGHAIGGLCGYAGTHSDFERVWNETGVELTEYPGKIHDCAVTATINAPGATHVGGLIGTGLYFFGEETAWDAYDCTVTAQISGAVMPGALAGRAENCSFENCVYSVEIDGSSAEAEIGTTEVMYESLDQ